MSPFPCQGFLCWYSEVEFWYVNTWMLEFEMGMTNLLLQPGVVEPGEMITPYEVAMDKYSYMLDMLVFIRMF